MATFGDTFGDTLDTHIYALSNLLPADYWQEENTLDYFIEEETGLILTLEDL